MSLSLGHLEVGRMLSWFPARDLRRGVLDEFEVAGAQILDKPVHFFSFPKHFKSGLLIVNVGRSHTGRISSNAC